MKYQIIKQENKSTRTIGGENNDLFAGLNGVLFKNSIESVLHLLNSQQMKGTFRYNEMNAQKLICRQLPWMEEKQKVFGAADESRLVAAMQKVGITDERNVKRAMDIIWDENRFNPFKEYLESLDLKKLCKGEDPTVTFLQDFLGAENTAYTQIVSQMLFRAMIAKTMYDPDFQYFIVLIGKQGIGKDTALRKIIPDKDWINTNFQYSTQLVQNTEQCNGNILCVLNDFNGFDRKEFDTFKAFISATWQTVRGKYEKKAKKVKIASVFCATTNNQNIVPNEQGNRRILPVMCNAASRKLLPWKDLNKKYRDTLWAWAYRNYKENQAVYPGKDFDILAQKEREKYFEIDPIELAVNKLCASGELTVGSKYSVLDIYNFIAKDLGFPKIDRSLSTQIGKILGQKKDIFDKKRSNGKLCYTYKQIDL